MRSCSLVARTILSRTLTFNSYQGQRQKTHVLYPRKAYYALNRRYGFVEEGFERMFIMFCRLAVWRFND